MGSISDAEKLVIDWLKISASSLCCSKYAQRSEPDLFPVRALERRPAKSSHCQLAPATRAQARIDPGTSLRRHSDIGVCSNMPSAVSRKTPTLASARKIL